MIHRPNCSYKALGTWQAMATSERPPKTSLPNRGTNGTIRAHHHYRWTIPVTLLLGKTHTNTHITDHCPFTQEYVFPGKQLERENDKQEENRDVEHPLEQ